VSLFALTSVAGMAWHLTQPPRRAATPIRRSLFSPVRWSAARLGRPGSVPGRAHVDFIRRGLFPGYDTMSLRLEPEPAAAQTRDQASAAQCDGHYEESLADPRCGVVSHALAGMIPNMLASL